MEALAVATFGCLGLTEVAEETFWTVTILEISVVLGPKVIEQGIFICFDSSRADTIVLAIELAVGDMAIIELTMWPSES